MDFKSSVKGTRELKRVFKNLPRSSARKIYMKSLREGAKLVELAAENNLKSVSDPFTGLAHRKSSITVYNLKKYKGNYRVSIQVKRGLVNTAKKDKNGQPVRVGLYLAVLEYGSQKLNRSPKSWIRKAIRENKDPAVKALLVEFNRRLPEAIEDAKR